MINPEMLPMAPSQRVATFAAWLREYARGSSDGICLETAGSHLITSALKEYDKNQQSVLSEDEKCETNLTFIKNMLTHDPVQLDKYVEDPVFLYVNKWTTRGMPRGIYCKSREGDDWVKQEKMLTTEELPAPAPGQEAQVPNYYNLTHLKVELKKFYEGLHVDCQAFQKDERLLDKDKRIHDWMIQNDLPKTTVDAKPPAANAPALSAPQRSHSSASIFCTYVMLFLIGAVVGGFTAQCVDGLTYRSEHTDSYGRTYHTRDVTPNFFAYMFGLAAALPLLVRLMVFVKDLVRPSVQRSVTVARTTASSLAVPLLSPVDDGAPHGPTQASSNPSHVVIS